MSSFGGLEFLRPQWPKSLRTNDLEVGVFGTHGFLKRVVELEGRVIQGSGRDLDGRGLLEGGETRALVPAHSVGSFLGVLLRHLLSVQFGAMKLLMNPCAFRILHGAVQIRVGSRQRLFPSQGIRFLNFGLRL